MKKYAADNLLFLRGQYPEIYKLIRNREMDKQRFVRDPAKNGQPNLLICEGEEQSRLYSRYNPGLEAARWVESLDDDVTGADHVLMFGFGLGYHAQALMEAYPDKRLYIYEPEKEMLLAAIETADLRDVLQNRQVAVFAVGEDSSVQSQMLVHILKSINGRMAFTAIPPYRKKYGAMIDEFVETMRRTSVGYQIDVNTITHFRREWARNALRNMECNLQSKSFQPLLNTCAGIPAVIVGSGPSLSMEIEKLRQVKDRALIISAGSSIQALLHHGIEPHLIVAMDAGEYNRFVFEKLDVAHIPFLYIPMIHYAAVTANDSPYLMHAFFEIDHLTHYLMNLTNEDAIFASSATVTGTAIQAAAHLGCREIVFIGQDFSYPNDRVYAEGVQHTDDQWQQSKIADSDLAVDNVMGGKNRTNRSMLNLKHDTEAVISAFPHISFHNASTVGAVIENTTMMTLDEAVEQWGPLSVQDDWFKQLVLEKATTYPNERKQFVKHRIRETLQEIVEMRMRFETLEELLEEASKLVPDRPKQIAGWFEKFDTVWSQILDSPVYKNVYAFFLLREQTIAERDWGQMVDEQDLFQKLIKLRDCIVPLVEGIRTMNPLFKRNFELLNEKLGAVKVN